MAITITMIWGYLAITIGKPWENQGKTKGKPWENGDLIGKPIGFHGYVMGLIPDWWFGTMELYDFPFSWEWKIIPTDFHSLVFFRGVSSNHQPDLVSLIFEVG